VWHGAAAALLLLGWLGAAEAGPPTGKPLMITLPPEVLATAEGANGFVVAGNFYSGGTFHWMPTSGVTSIGGSGVEAVSRDGKTIVGNQLDSRGYEFAALWTGGQTWRLLGGIGPARSCDSLVSAAYGANDTGTVVVGLGWDGCSYARAFRWEESTGMVDLGSLSGRSTRANGVSGDGRVVVGWETTPFGSRQGAKWVDGKEELILGPSGALGEAFAANRDASFIVGVNCALDTVEGQGTAWTWRSGEGVKCTSVDRPSWVRPNYYQLYMQATSDDGRVTGGSYAFGLDAESVVWFDGEPVFLRDYLRGHGIPDAFEGWVNTGFVTDVSADGRTLVGYGAGPTTFQGWIVVLPELGDK
jgi:probable HAF family extracellular repeat protein